MRPRGAQVKVDRGLPMGDGRVTAVASLERWLRCRSDRKARTPWRNTSGRSASHLVPALGDKRLVGSRADHVDDSCNSC